MAFTPTGVEFIAKNLNTYLSNLGKADKAQQRLGDSADKISGSYSKVTSAIGNFGKLAAGAALAGVVALGAGVVALGVNAIKTSISFESAFAGVVKTTDGLTSSVGKLNEAGLALRQEFVELSKTVPATFEELATIGELGGQLGVQKDQLIGFTKTIADLGNSTNLAQDEAASGLAQIANIYGVAADSMAENTNRMGSAIVALGNNFATTERDILNYTQRIAGAGAITGLSQADIAGIGTAFSSVGVEAEAGGTAVQKALLTINNAVIGSSTGFVDYSAQIDKNTTKMQKLNAESARLEAQFPGLQAEVLAQEQAFLASGGSADEFGRQLGDKVRQNAYETAKQLQDLQAETSLLKEQHGQPIDDTMLSTLASTAGVTVDEFKQLWEKDAAQAFTLFVEGLGEQGDAAIQTLESLGLTDQRLTRAFLSTAGAGDLLRNTIELSNTAFEENTALANEAAQRYATTESKIAILKNTFRAFSDAIGQRLLPIFNKVLDFGTDIISKFEKPVTKVLDRVFKAFDRFGIRGASNSILELLGFDPKEISQITSFVGQVINVVNRISSAFQNFGISGGSISILQLLGFDLGQIGEIFQLFNSIKLEVTKLVTNIVGIFGLAAQGATSFSWVDTIASSIAFVNQNFETFKNVIIAIGAVFGGLAIVATIAGIVAAINPLTVGIIAVGAAIGVLYTAWQQNWGGIQAIALTAVAVLQAVWNGIITAMQPVMASLQTLGQQFAQLGITWPVVWQAILEATLIVGTAIGVLILGLVSIISGFINMWASAATVIIPILTQLMTNFQTFAMGLVQIFQGDVFNGISTVLIGLGQLVSTIFTGMFEFILAATNGFIEGVIAFWTGLYQELIGGSIVPDLVNGIVNAFVQLGTRVTAAVSNMVGQAISQFSGFISKAQELFSIEKFVRMGSDVINGLVKGIKENANKVVSALGDVVKKAIDAVLSTLGIKSPSKVFADIGTEIVNGLIIGAKSEQGDLEKDFQSLAESAVTVMNNVFKENKVQSGKQGSKMFRDQLRKQLVGQLRDNALAGTFGRDNIIQAMFGTMARNFDGAPAIGDVFGKLVDAMDADFKAKIEPVLKKISQKIAASLAQSATSFLSLGQTSVKRMLDPLQKTVDETTAALKDSSISVMFEGAETTLDDLFKRRNEFKKLQQEAILNGKELTEKQIEEWDAIQKTIDEVKAASEGNFISVMFGGEETTLDDLFRRRDEFRKLHQEAILNGKQLTKEQTEEWHAIGRTIALEAQNNQQAKDRLKLLNEQQQAQDKLVAAKEQQLKLEKQQADLQFLQQQLGLLQNIRDLGLDPADILKGIKLGLDADLGSLADAMARVVDTIIGQVDSTLQIASPSKIMIDRGRQVVAGLMEGMKSQAMNLQSTVQAIGQIPLSMPSNTTTNTTTNSINIGDIVMKDEGLSPMQVQQLIRKTVIGAI